MVVAVQYRRPSLNKNVMVQIYGIDLGMSSFDVSFLSESGSVRHLSGVKNTVHGISKFLLSLPSSAVLCAEHTGVYGDLLLRLCTLNRICLCFVPGYQIKHSLGLQRGKSDPLDACRIREYAERFYDLLRPCFYPGEEMSELQELYRTRSLLVESRKRLDTLNIGDNCKSSVSLAADHARRAVLAELNTQISGLDHEIEALIQNSSEFSRNHQILTSIVGVGPVTSCELIIKTENFRKLDTAKKCAAYAGIAPYPKESGKMKCGHKISPMGDKQLKTLLFLCARSAKEHNKEIRLYFLKKHKVEKKHFFVAMNNIANKLLRLIYSLIQKQQTYDRDYIQRDPRCVVISDTNKC